LERTEIEPATPCKQEPGVRDVAMVAKVYGRFKPDNAERDRRERIAPGRDQEKRPGRIATNVASAAEEVEKPHEETPATDWVDEGSANSRGGTRTRDPGIMRNGALPCPRLSAYRTPRAAP
jgi:hypothetical protein